MASGEGTGAVPLLLKWLGVDLQFGGEEGDISGKNLLAIFFKCRNFFSFANSLTVLLGSTPCHTENKVWLDCIFMNVCGISGCATTWLELYSACGLPRTIGQSSPHRSCVFHSREVLQKQRWAMSHSLWLLKVNCWHSKGFAYYAEVLNRSDLDT